MNKYFIMALSCLIIVGLVFGISYEKTIDIFSDNVIRITDKVDLILHGLEDLNIIDFGIRDLERSKYIDYRYANFGSYDNFKLGHWDKAYTISNYMVPSWIHDEDSPMLFLRIDPDYQYVDVKAYDSANDEFYFLIEDGLSIHYEITFPSKIMGAGNYTEDNNIFDVFVVFRLDSFDHYYVVRDRSEGDRVIVSTEFNTRREYSQADYMYQRLNGFHSLARDNCQLFSVTKSKYSLYDEGDDDVFYKFLKETYK